MFVSLELDARRAMKAYRQHQAAAMVRVIQLLKEAETQEVLSLPLDIKEVKGCPHGRYGSTQPPMPENFAHIGISRLSQFVSKLFQAIFNEP